MDVVNGLLVILVILTSLVLADLILTTVLAMMDFLDPGRVRVQLAAFLGLTPTSTQVLSEPGTTASSSKP